jgi:hypothetical protein
MSRGLPPSPKPTPSLTTKMAFALANVEVNADDEVDDDAVAPNTSDTSTNTKHMDHGTHIELQDQTASELFGGGAPYAVFDCPAYNTVFNPLYPVYLFYRHLSKPGH